MLSALIETRRRRSSRRTRVYACAWNFRVRLDIRTHKAGRAFTEERGQYAPRLYYIYTCIRGGPLTARVRIPGGRLLFPRSYLRALLFGGRICDRLRAPTRCTLKTRHIAMTEAYALARVAARSPPFVIGIRGFRANGQVTPHAIDIARRSERIFVRGNGQREKERLPLFFLR